MPVWPVINVRFGDAMPHRAIAIEVHHRADWSVDGELLPIDTQPRNLGIEIRKVPSLQQGIITESDAGNDMAGTERNLLDLGEILIDSTIEDEFADLLWIFGSITTAVFVIIAILLLRGRGSRI